MDAAELLADAHADGPWFAFGTEDARDLILLQVAAGRPVALARGLPRIEITSDPSSAARSHVAPALVTVASNVKNPNARLERTRTNSEHLTLPNKSADTVVRQGISFAINMTIWYQLIPAGQAKWIPDTGCVRARSVILSGRYGSACPVAHRRGTSGVH